MTLFNPSKKESLTLGECLEPAMKITEQGDADQYLKQYIAFIQISLDKEPRKDAMTAEQIAKINLGYWAGYYDNETRERVEKLFKCVHPISGSIKDNGAPTPKEAFESGQAIDKTKQ